MKQIIINADDFGINEVVTAEIENQIKAGNVSSTTVMANGLCLDKVKRFATFHPEISFGVHLCLSEFDSITKSSSLRQSGIIDENGSFIHKEIFKLKQFSEDTKKAISEELNAQIDIVSSMGFPISHADSHHHVHTIYPLKEVFADVLNKRGIKKIRIGGDFRTWQTRRHVLLWIRRLRLNKYYNSHFITTNAFYSYAEYLKMGQRCGDNIIELMCHPGHPGQQYRDEMKSAELKEALKSEDIKLITYNDLH
jgi:predicted glycoside hydrolase/deacetylase ChbG (UPF0249 family)